MSSVSERRLGADRRRRPTPLVSRYWLVGRRRGGRRADERQDLYVDRYAPAEWLAWSVLCALCVIDWLWTIAHLQRGVAEANPMLAWAHLCGGVLGFSALKLVLTWGPAAVLLVHLRFRCTRALLPLALVCYTGVLGVHVWTEVMLQRA